MTGESFWAIGGDKNKHCAKIVEDLYYKPLKELPRNIPSNSKKIYLYDYNLTVLKSGLFRNSPFLVDIHLNKNCISEIEEGTFIGLPKKIRRLYLMANKLKKLEGKMWKGLKEVLELSVGYNELTFISHESFGPDLDVTERLHLEGNRLKHVDPDSLRSMQHGPVKFYLGSNDLEWVPCFRDKKHHIRENDTRGLVLTVDGNPLRCQPQGCWTASYINGNGKMKCGATNCQNLDSLQEEYMEYAHCCRAIETHPSPKCVSNIKPYDSVFEQFEHIVNMLIEKRCVGVNESRLEISGTINAYLPKGFEITNNVTDMIKRFKDYYKMILEMMFHGKNVAKQNENKLQYNKTIHEFLPRGFEIKDNETLLKDIFYRFNGHVMKAAYIMICRKGYTKKGQNKQEDMKLLHDSYNGKQSEKLPVQTKRTKSTGSKTVTVTLCSVIIDMMLFKIMSQNNMVT